MSWKIDSAHSEINFTVRHMMIANVRGRFETFEGAVEFDQDRPESTQVEVRIDAASLNTREEQRDAHLRSADFLDVANHPDLLFRSTRIELLDKTNARMYGDLTIKNVTRPVVMDVEFNGISKSPWGAVVVGFSAHTRINRKDWDLTWNVALETGGWLVGEEIKIDIDVELVKQEEPALAAA